MLRALLIEPLTFTPIVDGRCRVYAFEGMISLDRLLSGVVDLPTRLASQQAPSRVESGLLSVDGYADLHAV